MHWLQRELSFWLLSHCNSLVCMVMQGKDGLSVISVISVGSMMSGIDILSHRSSLGFIFIQASR